MKRFLAGLILALASCGVLAGQPCQNCPDMATKVVSGTFTGTGGGTSGLFFGPFNIQLSGSWVGTVQLERSFDGGATFVAAAKDTSGSAAAYTSNVSIVVNEVEPGVIYRWNCTAYTSGTVSFRISKGPAV